MHAIREGIRYYEDRMRAGSLPLVGVNTFLPKDHAGEVVTTIELIRSTEAEMAQQISNVGAWQAFRNSLLPLPLVGEGLGEGLKYLQSTAHKRENSFAALMEAVTTHSLGQVSHALYDVGGEYRRNM